MEKTITLSKSFQWLFLLFMMLFAFVASAQITITQDDMPVAGMVVMRDMDTATIQNPGGAGMNQTWDFSAAVTYLSDTVTYSLPAEVPGGSMFPEANLAEGRTIFDPAGDFSNYIFWNSAEDGMYAVGWNLSFTFPGYSFNSTQQYDPDPNTLPLPFTYGETNSVTTTGVRYSSTWIENMQLDSSRVITHITLNSEVDGSGTVITPVGTYPALRVVEVSNHVDSTWTWTAVSGWTFERTETFELTNYRWFANTFGEVATLSIDDESIQFQFLSSIIIDVANIDYTADIKVYPNPAGELLFISSSTPVNRAEVYSVNGQLLFTARDNNSIDISQLEPGMYICRISTNGAFSSSKFIKK